MSLRRPHAVARAVASAVAPIVTSSVIAAVAFLAPPALARAATLDAAALALRSGGTVAGGDVTLDENGFLGTYVTLAAPGRVDLSVNALGVADAGVAPRLNLVVDDYKVGFDVAAEAEAYAGSVTLPAGTHLVRLEYANDHAAAAARRLTFKTLSVTGATFANQATDANALAAADTYIAHYRRGDARVALTGPGGVPLLAGTNVRAKMARNQFNFGGTLSGANVDDPKNMLAVADPSPDIEAGKFQAFVRKNFNTVVASNGGKWVYTEPTRNDVDMSLPDRQLDWAAANHKRARMHTLIWGTDTDGGKQEPTWVRALIAAAAAGDPVAKADLRTAISSRIKYYAGATGNRSRRYVEVDGLNESLHNPAYTNIFGTRGVADIYDELNAAIAAAGGRARTYLNEWNVLQYSPASVTARGAGVGSDAYANYYRRHIDEVRDAGGDVGGVGIQYYANYTQAGPTAHSAATIGKALGNLSVGGLPISMAEFGGGTTMNLATSAAGATVLDETLRMFYGSANATTFMIWGWWELPTGPTPPAALLDNTRGNDVLTPMGAKWEQMMALWSTDLTAPVDADGKLNFNGHYGDYNVGGAPAFSNLALVKGTTDYALQLAAPPGWSLFDPAAATGDWSTVANWSAGVPGGAGITAHFPSAPTARAISLDADVTLGQLNFDGVHAYRVIGEGSIALRALAGEAAMNVVAGDHEITVPVVLASDARAIVREAGSTLTLRVLAGAPLRSLAKRGVGTLAVDHVRLAALSVEAGAVAMLPTTRAARVNVVNALSVAEGATLDVGDSIWAIDHDASADPTPAIRALILAGRAGGAGIRDGSRGGDPRRGIGYAGASAVPAGALAGEAFDATTLVVRATWRGDADLDGVVGLADLVALARHYDPAVAGRAWSDGDSNLDGRVDLADLVALVQNYGRGPDPRAVETTPRARPSRR